MAKYHKRVFLNKTGSGHIEFKVGECSGAKSVDTQFTVQDCYRKAELDFNCYGRQRKAEVLKKLKTFVESVLEFDAALREELGKIKRSD